MISECLNNNNNLVMEHIRTAKVENVKLLDKITPKSSPVGTLYLTTSHLIFIDEKEKKELWILHMLMQTIEKPILTTSGSQLKILCSNFQNVTFMIAVRSDFVFASRQMFEITFIQGLKSGSGSRGPQTFPKNVGYWMTFF